MPQYHIIAPQQRTFNASKGEWENVPPFTAPHPIFGVTIKDGEGFTEDLQTAVEFADMGYRVEPNPKAQEATPKVGGGKPKAKKG